MLHASYSLQAGPPLWRRAVRLLNLLLVLVLLVSLSDQATAVTLASEPVTIPGSPLSIIVSDDASIQVRRAGAFGSDLSLNGLVYPNFTGFADSGIFVRYGLDTIGPDFDSRDITALFGRFQTWSTLSTPALSGSGALTDPFRLQSALEHSSGLSMNIDVQYVNTRDYFTLSWTVCPPAGEAGFTTYLAADVQLTSTLPESSQSSFSPLTGAVGAYNPSSGWSEHFQPLTPADAYMISNDIVISPTLSRPLWDTIQAGENLSNSAPPISQPGDNSIALQWNQPANDCRTLAVEWHVLLGPSIPELLNRRIYLPVLSRQ